MGELNALLLREQDRLRSESRELREQITRAEEKLQKIDERLAHVDGLLGPDHVSEDGIEEKPVADSHDIVGLAAEILSERNKEPMHYRELAREIEARGGDIPGVDKDHTLIARLVKDERFVRPTRRGFYALRKDYPDAKNVGARKQHGNNDTEEFEESSGTSSDSPSLWGK